MPDDLFNPNFATIAYGAEAGQPSEQHPLVTALAVVSTLTPATVDRAKLLEVRDKLRNVVLIDEGATAEMTSIIKSLKETGKALDTLRDGEVRPLNTQVKDINARYKQLTSVIDEIEVNGKAAIKSFMQIEQAKRNAEEAARRKAEQERLIAVAAEQKSEEVQEAVMEIAAAQTAPRVEAKAAPVTGNFGGTAGTAKKWVFTLDDITKVPADLLLLNESAVRARIAAGARDIPGLTIKEDFNVNIR